MRLVFMGTPEFAVKSLQTLYKSRHEIAAVVTAVDKPRGRGRKVTPPPVKQMALELELPVLQPKNLKSEQFTEKMKFYNPDLNVVVAFRILPETVFTLPKLGSVNLHASLLPKYRGAAPINWALINGETKTGVTTFLLNKRVDTGAILLQREVSIAPDDDAGGLHDKLMNAGAGLLLETVDGLESGSLKPMPQDDSEVSAAPKLTPDTGKIDWRDSAEKIFNLVRGLSPYPGAYGYLEDKKIIMLKSERIISNHNNRPGEIIESSPKSGISIACGKDILKILELKPQGKKVMGSAEFVRGYNVKVGSNFEY